MGYMFMGGLYDKSAIEEMNKFRDGDMVKLNNQKAYRVRPKSLLTKTQRKKRKNSKIAKASRKRNRKKS